MKYGFIGLGNLGGKIASNLLKAGFELQVHDLNRQTAEPLVAQGAVWCDSPKGAASGVDGLITCLTSPKVSTQVVAGPDGALSGMAEGSTWIEISTTEVDELMARNRTGAAKGDQHHRGTGNRWCAPCRAG